jgi:hypothetical protein
LQVTADGLFLLLAWACPLVHRASAHDQVRERTQPRMVKSTQAAFAHPDKSWSRKSPHTMRMSNQIQANNNPRLG